MVDCNAHQTGQGSESMAWVIGVDVGGTFTDFYALDDRAGTAVVHKTPSTPDHPAQAIVDGLQALCAQHAIDTAAIRRLSHGTTVATNTLLQRRGATVALITTHGFRDLLEIGRQIRPHMFSLQEDYPTPLVPRERRYELAERMLADGEVLRPLDPDSLQRALAHVRASGAQACAVCLLFAFVNPEHEQAIGKALETIPDLYVSLSSEVQPEFREYERLSTTVLNAYLQPIIANYLHDLGRQLAERLPRAALGINQSSGGLMSFDRARQFPIRTALSGPAAGAIGAIDTARRAEAPDIITLDMGGPARMWPWYKVMRPARATIATWAAFPCVCRWSTFIPSGPAAARSPGSTAMHCSRSDRSAPVPRRVRPVTAWAVISPRSRTPTCFWDGCRPRGCSGAPCPSM